MAEEHDSVVVSMLDVLEEGNELEEEAAAVLGDSDDKCCTYPLGYVKRQALYACKTCSTVNEALAGICLACSYECHDGHDFVELYTKRNFRCDCGNSKFPQLSCKLFKIKQPENPENHYNQNFSGLYCTCHRPYPDPEDEIEDEMIQCVICEDWFHGRHLGLDVIPESSDYQEMVCESCMKQCDFLWKYRVHSIETRVTIAETSSDIDVTSHSQEQNRSCQSFSVKPEIRAVKAEPASNGLSTCTTLADGNGNSGTSCSNSAPSCSNKPEATTQQTPEAVVSSSTTAQEKANANDAISTDVKDSTSPTNDSLLNPPSVITPADGLSECVSSSTGSSTEFTHKSTATRTVVASKESGRECEATSSAVSVSDMPAVNVTNQTPALKTEAIPTTSIASTSQADASSSSRPSPEQKDVGHSSQSDQQFASAAKGNGQSAKEVLDTDSLAKEEKGTRLCKLIELSKRDILKSKGAVFWPSGWREKLCSCDECQAMYARLGVAFLQDGGDTVVAYEERGKVKRKGSQYDQGMEALSSMNRVQQVEMLHGYQDMKSALSDFLKGFVEQGKVVTATDIQDFYQGLTRKRQRIGSAGTVQYLCK